MKRFYVFYGILFLCFAVFGSASKAAAQQNDKEVYTGTLLSYGSGFNTRNVTTTFTLNINGQTSDAQAQGFLDILREDEQTDLLKAIEKEDLGRFSVGANVGVPVNVVCESIVGGKRRIFIVFQRWTQFAELRGGYRSLDYPFGVIELFIDEQTGKGEGTYIAAAKIRWDYDDKKKQYQVEIENFATYPARLLGVQLRGERKRRIRVGS